MSTTRSGRASKDLVRVVALTQDRLVRRPWEELVDNTFERMELAAVRQPDIVCLPETFPQTDPEPVPGPVIDRVAAWAREKKCYVICPLHVRVEGTVYNSAVVLDRSGEIAGRYDKIHPTEGEIEGGIQPGPLDPPVFATEFGPIGIQICFDVNWSDAWRRLKDKGARIVFFPSAFPAPRHLATWAWLHECYVVSATKSRAASIFDITGETIDSSGMFKPWAEAALHLDKRLFEIDYHVKKVHDIEKKYGTRVEVVWFNDEDWFTLATTDPELSVQQIIDEFELTPLWDYLPRALGAQDEARNSAPSPQPDSP